MLVPVTVALSSSDGSTGEHDSSVVGRRVLARDGLASESGGSDGHFVTPQPLDISRDDASTHQETNVARHKLRRGNDNGYSSVAQDGGFTLDGVGEFIETLLGVVIFTETQDCVDNEDTKDDTEIGIVTHSQGNKGCNLNEEGKESDKLTNKQLVKRSRLGWDLVQPILVSCLFNFSVSQTLG